MTTLTLNSKPSIREVPLEDWYEEMADESLDPLNQLIAEEEEAEPPKVYYGSPVDLNDANNQYPNRKEEAIMTTTIANNTSFNLDAWMNTLAVLTKAATPAAKVFNKPEWLEIKGPLVANNSFAITAGVIKGARRITDGLFVAKNRHAVAVEALHVQEARSARQTPLETNFGPVMTNLGRMIAEQAGVAMDAPGFNPDGTEFDAALTEAAEEVEALELVIANGSAMMNELLEWIKDVSVDLQLQVETGRTVTKDLIGNTFSKPRYEPLNASTLMYGIAAQKEFIKNARNTQITTAKHDSEDVMDRMGR